MNDFPFAWDDIDLTFGIEMPDFGADAEDAALSIVEDVFRLPVRNQTDGRPRLGRPLPRRKRALRAGI